MFDALIISCEHGGNKIPEKYRHLFEGAESVLQTHRGYDIGALELSLHMAQELSCDFFYSIVSRLLVEANRSPESPELFSDFTTNLPEKDKQDILREYYEPFRSQVELAVNNLIFSGKAVLHISVHTFTPVLGGKIRKADIGILLDESRKNELTYAQRLKKTLKKLKKGYVIRKNYPYKGTDDGFTRYLRTKYPAEKYSGIELEVNSRLCESRSSWIECQKVLTDAVGRLMKQ